MSGVAQSIGIWYDRNPTLTGFSTLPTTAAYRYTWYGKSCTFYYTPSANGTSNSTTKTIDLPFPAANTASQFIWLRTTDGGTINAAMGRLVTTAGSAVATVEKTVNTNSGWTASGACSFIIPPTTYEIA